MKPEPSFARLTSAELEAETEASRLTSQIDKALATVAVRSLDTAEDLEVHADQIDRMAHNLAMALRGLARERRQSPRPE